MSILVVGSIAYDTVETPFGKVDNALGGSTLYFSAAASLFSPVNVVGVIGSDFDTSHLEFLKKRSVNFDGLYTEKGDTFRWGGRYHSNMNQRDTLFTYLNVFENFNPQIPEQYKKARYVFLANIAPELQLQVLEQIEKPQLVVLDTMNFWISGKRAELEKVVRQSNIVIMNDEEVLEFTGEVNIIKAVKAITALGPDKVVVKKGEHGALLYSGSGSFFITPAYPVERVVDPTGAGDSFAGGFLGYIAQKEDSGEETIRKALVFGCTMASFTVEDFSLDNLKKLDNNRLDKRFAEMKELTRF